MDAVAVSPNRRLRDGADVNRTVRDLRELATAAGNARSFFVGGVPDEMLERYLDWADMAERRLISQLDYVDVAELVHTRRYWALRNMGPGSARLQSLISLELDQRQRQLDDAADALEQVAARWRADPALIAVLDTNVLMEQDRVDKINWWQLTGWSGDLRLVVPLIVVDELDRLKVTGGRDGARRARFAVGMLHGLLTEDPETRPVLAEQDGVSVTLEVLVDPAGHVRLDDSDYEIIDRAVHVRQLSGGPVTLVTGDLGMELRAIGQALDTLFLEPPEKD